jgi:hypothetical protein
LVFNLTTITLEYRPVSEDSERMTEQEYQQLLAKINREWPIRIKLAGLAGFTANYKNPRALMDTEFDLSIRDLYLEVLFRKPDNAPLALQLIQEYYK